MDADTTLPSLNEENTELLKERYNLSYHISNLQLGVNMVGFKGMKVLEVGGSLPRELVMDIVGAQQWIGIEETEYWSELPIGDQGRVTGTPPREKLNTLVTDVGDFSELKSYQVLEGKVENLPESFHSQFNRVFSIACFEHVHTLSLALDRMYKALKPGGRLFTMFSPIWSAANGHHLPSLLDQNGDPVCSDSQCPPIPAWAHLLLSPPQMAEYLKGKLDEVTIAKIIYYIYHSSHINRLKTEDYVAYFESSPFKCTMVYDSYTVEMPEGVQSELENRYPGYKRFGNCGLLAVLDKPFV